MAISKAPQGPIRLIPIEQDTLIVEVKGTSPLIVHAWSQKAKQMILDKQSGKKPQREPKDPVQDYLDSMYRLTDGRTGMPATAFKKATVAGGRFFKGSVTMAELRPMLYVWPDDPMTGLVAINGEPRPREDMVRNSGQTADIRYRAEYPEWSATLRVDFYPHMIAAESVVNLIEAGGRVGIGELRPEKGTGMFGMYEVVTTK